MKRNFQIYSFFKKNMKVYWEVPYLIFFVITLITPTYFYLKYFDFNSFNSSDEFLKSMFFLFILIILFFSVLFHITTSTFIWNDFHKKKKLSWVSFITIILIFFLFFSFNNPVRVYELVSEKINIDVNKDNYKFISKEESKYYSNIWFLIWWWKFFFVEIWWEKFKFFVNENSLYKWKNLTNEEKEKIFKEFINSNWWKFKATKFSKIIINEQ